MAVKLLLDNQEVITDSTQEIKITRENPYFTLSDSYLMFPSRSPSFRTGSFSEAYRSWRKRENTENTPAGCIARTLF